MNNSKKYLLTISSVLTFSILPFFDLTAMHRKKTRVQQNKTHLVTTDQGNGFRIEEEVNDNDVNMTDTQSVTNNTTSTSSSSIQPEANAKKRPRDDDQEQKAEGEKRKKTGDDFFDGFAQEPQAKTSATLPTSNHTQSGIKSPQATPTQQTNQMHAGLANLGNTCFMNATLQVLFNIKSLNDILDHKAQPNDELTTALVALKNSLLNGNQVVDPTRFIKAAQNSGIGTIIGNRTSRNHEQQDASEFLMQFLNKISHTNKDAVDNIFQFTTQSTTTTQEDCKICGRKKGTFSTRYNLTKSIELPINHQDLTLKAALENYTKIEPLTDYHCGICAQKLADDEIAKIQQTNPRLSKETILADNNLRKQIDSAKAKAPIIKATKQLKIFEAPLVLTIVLKRFDSLHNKISTPLTLPLSDLDITQEKTSPTKYNLMGFICHIGTTLNLGHYVAYIRDYINGKWYLCNDRDVSEVAETQIEGLMQDTSSTPYILFYQRQTQAPEHSSSSSANHASTSSTSTTTTNTANSQDSAKIDESSAKILLANELLDLKRDCELGIKILEDLAKVGYEDPQKMGVQDFLLNPNPQEKSTPEDKIKKIEKILPSLLTCFNKVQNNRVQQETLRKTVMERILRIRILISRYQPDKTNIINEFLKKIFECVLKKEEIEELLKLDIEESLKNETNNSAKNEQGNQKEIDGKNQYNQFDYIKAKTPGEKNLLGAILIGADLSDANLEGVNLSYADLSNAKLNKANLKGATLCGANLSGAHLEDANLENANFSSISENRKTNLSGAFLNRAKFIKTKLEGVNLNGADLSCPSLGDNFGNNIIKLESLASLDDFTSFMHATLEGADLTNTNFSGTIFLKTNFEKAIAVNSNFSGTCFYGGNTKEMTIHSSNFTKAILQDIDFEQIKLIGSTLTEAKINNVTFKKCNIKNELALFSVIPSGLFNILSQNKPKLTQINNAELVKVTFEATDLIGIDFEGSTLSECKIKNTSLCNANFKGATLDTCLFIGRIKEKYNNPNWIERAVSATTKFFLSCNPSVMDSTLTFTNFNRAKIKDVLFTNSIFHVSSLTGTTTINGVVFDNCFLGKTETKFLMTQEAKVNGTCNLAYEHKWKNEPSTAEKFGKDLVNFSTQKAAALVIGFIF